MTKLSVYDYRSYKKFILDWIALAPAKGRGQRKLLAQAIGCQTPFVTQVFNGEYHFSPEQAEACARWLALPRPETDYFLLLVLRGRAGSKSLAALLDRQLDESRERQDQLTQRLKISETISQDDQLQYFSSWQYAAVQISLLNHNSRTIEDLRQRFAIPLPRLMEILNFLTAKKMIRLRGNRYEVLRPVMHLGRESPLLPKHHANWRLRSIEAIEAGNPHDFHYSGVISASKDDYEWVKGKLSKLLEELVERVKGSSDERQGCLCLDLFEL